MFSEFRAGPLLRKPRLDNTELYPLKTTGKLYTRDKCRMPIQKTKR